MRIKQATSLHGASALQSHPRDPTLRQNVYSYTSREASEPFGTRSVFQSRPIIKFAPGSSLPRVPPRVFTVPGLDLGLDLIALL